MIIESVGHVYRWIKDRQAVEVQRKILDPITDQTWYEYQIIVYTNQAKILEQSNVGKKLDVTV